MQLQAAQLRAQVRLTLPPERQSGIEELLKFSLANEGRALDNERRQ